ncbi:MAG: TOMM precursor leader peptide-binding protein [Promethearchaeota archaeon]
MNYPRIFPSIEIYETIDNRLIFRLEKKDIIVTGNALNLVKKLIPFLNGKFTFKEIIKKSKIPEKDVKKIITFLKRKNIVIDSRYIKDKDYKKFSYFKKYLDNKKMSEIISNIQKNRILIIGDGDIKTYLIDFLSYFDIKNLKIIKNIDYINNFFNMIKKINLIVLCQDNYLPKECDIINKQCIENEIPWISCRITDYGDGEIGPFVIPKKTSCFKCYEYRLKSNLEYREEYNDLIKIKEKEIENLDIMKKIIAAYTVLEILKFLIKYKNPITINNVLSIDFENYNNIIHPVLKIPNCPVCGDI